MGYDTTSPIQIFIGYDENEHEAFEVCVSSLEDVTSDHRELVQIHKLHTSSIPGWYREREAHQSTDFTYTRFLVPYLMGYRGVGIFVDCDFVFLESPKEMVDNYFSTEYAVSVVKHPQYVPRTSVKMDGKTQHVMARKNWASMMMFNCSHQQNETLTFDYVNSHMPGRELHQLAWADDSAIGSLPLEWNCLDDYYLLESPKAVHFTDGGPWFEDYRNTMYSYLWYDADERRLTKLIEDGERIEDDL